jgi:uncharacterized membrane protein YhaH (DUF805 family)
MSPAEAITSVFTKYATFSGRARRSEFWWFALMNAIVSNVLYFVTIGPSYQSALSNNDFSDFSFGIGGAIYVLYALAVLVPGLAVTWRRLHDTNRSGAYAFMTLIPFVGWIFVLVAEIQEGTRGPNNFGPDPKA